MTSVGIVIGVLAEEEAPTPVELIAATSKVYVAPGTSAVTSVVVTAVSVVATST